MSGLVLPSMAISPGGGLGPRARDAVEQLRACAKRLANGGRAIARGGKLATDGCAGTCCGGGSGTVLLHYASPSFIRTAQPVSLDTTEELFASSDVQTVRVTLSMSISISATEVSRSPILPADDPLQFTQFTETWTGSGTPQKIIVLGMLYYAMPVGGSFPSDMQPSRAQVQSHYNAAQLPDIVEPRIVDTVGGGLERGRVAFRIVVSETAMNYTYVGSSTESRQYFPFFPFGSSNGVSVISSAVRFFNLATLDPTDGLLIELLQEPFDSLSNVWASSPTTNDQIGGGIGLLGQPMTGSRSFAFDPPNVSDLVSGGGSSTTPFLGQKNAYNGSDVGNYTVVLEALPGGPQAIAYTDLDEDWDIDSNLAVAITLEETDQTLIPGHPDA